MKNLLLSRGDTVSVNKQKLEKDSTIYDTLLYMKRFWFFTSFFTAIVILFLTAGYISVSTADYCGPDPQYPSIRVDKVVSVGCDPQTGCYETVNTANVEYCSVSSCSKTFSEPYCTNGVNGACGQSYRDRTVYCWVSGGTPTPTPTPTPSAGCGTCNEYASPNNCANTCSGTTCGRCSNGGADCAWGSKSCGGPGPTPTPTPTCTLPVAPTLLTPTAGENIIGTTASLSWRETVADWGNCTGTLKSFRVFVDAGACNVFSIPSTIQTNTTNTSYNFTGTSGQSYCWSVVARKSATVISPKARPFRTFTLCTNSLPNPALTTPSDGSTVNSPIILSWSLTNWGNRCYASPNDQFKVYLGSNPPPLWSTITDPSIRSTTYSSGTAGQKYYWKVAATNDGWVTTKETGISSFTLAGAPSSSWFQVDGGDAVAFGDITSPAGSNDFVTGAAAAVISNGTVSVGGQTTGLWKIEEAGLSASLKTDNSYARFKIRVTNRITPQTTFDPSNLDGSCTSSNQASDGACYFTSPTEITLPAQTINNNKIVLLIDANVNISGNISLTNSGLLVVLSGGDITLTNSLVTSLQGVYLAQAAFNTGIYDTALTVNGTVVGLGNVNLQRTYNTNPSIPAEKFIYEPVYFSALPTTLYEQHRQWQEQKP